MFGKQIKYNICSDFFLREMMVSKVFLATTEIMEWTVDLDPRDLLETLDCQAEMVSKA